MGILDGIVEWIAEQIMAGLDLVTTSVLGALGCDMTVFLRYFPAAETMYGIFVALAVGLILLNWVWQLFKNFGLSAGIEAEDPVKLSIRSVLFILLALFSDEIINTILTIGGTPYRWIMDSELPPLSFADFNSVMLVIIGVCANGAVALITLILVVILAWNYLKLLLEAAERYVLLGVLVYMGIEDTDVESTLCRVGLPGTGSQPVSTFSLGMRQRLAIARAIIHRPEVLILDEPVNGLDPVGMKAMRILFRRLVQEEGMTILMSSHLLSEIEQIADRVGVIVDGTVVQEAEMADIRKQHPSNMEDYFISLIQGGADHA